MLSNLIKLGKRDLCFEIELDDDYKEIKLMENNEVLSKAYLYDSQNIEEEVDDIVYAFNHDLNGSLSSEECMELGKELVNVYNDYLNLLKNNNDVKYHKEGFVSDLIKRKLTSLGGRATFKMLDGPTTAILKSNGVSFAVNEKFVFPFELFDGLFNKCKELGKMYVVAGLARGGQRIGEGKLTLNTVDGFLATEYFNAKVGDTILGISSYACALLNWVGVVNYNRSSNVEGCHIIIHPRFR